MDIDTIEICWNIFQRYVKSSDQSHAVSHLVTELLEAGLQDDDLKQLSRIDSNFAQAVEDNSNDDDEYWLNDEDDWE